jgi:hypothetical protein
MSSASTQQLGPVTRTPRRKVPSAPHLTTICQHSSTNAANDTTQRTYDQITRSPSRTASIEPRPKRRRTEYPPSLTPLPSRSPPPRYAGDGFDFRRPAMSASQAPVIDLTNEDDDDNYQSDFSLAFMMRDEDDGDDADFEPPETSGNGLGPADRQRVGDLRNDHQLQSPEVRSANTQPLYIISDDEDDAEVLRTLAQPLRRESTSSDLEILREGPASAPVTRAPRPSVRNRPPTPGSLNARDDQRNRRPQTNDPPPPLPGLAGLPDFIRRSTQTLLNIPSMFRTPEPAPDMDELEIMPFDYRQAAFAMGADRSSETPQAAPGAAYREPPPVPEGFAGDVDENEVYVCPRCEEELATGDTDEKRQVWVVRQCGHVRYPCSILTLSTELTRLYRSTVATALALDHSRPARRKSELDTTSSRPALQRIAASRSIRNPPWSKSIYNHRYSAQGRLDLAEMVG